MIGWLIVVVVLLLGVFIYYRVRTREAKTVPDGKAQKRCFFCSEEISEDAKVCRSCGRGVIN